MIHKDLIFDKEGRVFLSEVQSVGLRCCTAARCLTAVFACEWVQLALYIASSFQCLICNFTRGMHFPFYFIFSIFA